MSVLIKGMEMPKNCGECHFCHTENFHQWCCLTEETISAIDAKHFMCPLTQLEPCEDAVSRQAAIDALEKVASFFPYRVPGNRDTYDKYSEAWNDAIGRAEIEIEKLQSAQPTIIRCKDCKYWKEKPYKYCERMYHMGFAELLDYMVEENDFCSWAVKRGDTE